jgi:hypothetical protein
VPGHPDGQNYAIWRGPSFAASNAFSLSNSHPFTAQGQITNYASFVIYAAPTNPGGTTVTVNFYTDSTQTISLGGFSWTLPGNSLLHVTVPGLGNFCTVSITTSDVASATMFVAVYPTNTPVEAPSYAGPGNFVQGFNVNVPASSTITAVLPYVSEGKGYIFIADHNSTGHLTGRIVTTNAAGGSVARLIDWNTLSSFQAQEFVCPATPIRLEVDNTDAAAAHTVNYFLAVDGR